MSAKGRLATAAVEHRVLVVAPLYQARTGRAADELVVTGDNLWTAPDVPGPVSLWIMLRDDCEAAGWRIDVEVTP